MTIGDQKYSPNEREQVFALGSHYNLIRERDIFRDALRQIALEDPTREYAGKIAREALAKTASLPARPTGKNDEHNDNHP